METTIIVLICVNIGASLLAPLVTASAHFIDRLTRSNCMGNTVELQKSAEIKREVDLTEIKKLLEKYNTK